MTRLALRLLLLAPVPLVIALTNYAVDPASLFHPGTERRLAQLLEEGHTVWGVDNYDERLVERYYIERLTAAPRTIVLGSSRMMLVRGAMLSEPSFFNHGVSGASVEDFLAIIGIYEQRQLRLRRVVIGVDPWLFNRHNEQDRWMSVADDYRGMATRLQLDVPHAWETWRPWGRIPEVLSVKYFQISAKELRKGRAAFHRPQPVAGDGEDPAGKTILPDGSIAYPRSQYKSADETARIALEFALTRPPYSLGKFGELDGRSERAFTRLVSHLREAGTSVAFALPPYHPVAYRLLAASQDYGIIVDAERWIRAFAESQGIPLAGSYDPDLAGCTGDEFFDGMHARASCMRRLLSELTPGMHASSASR